MNLDRWTTFSWQTESHTWFYKVAEEIGSELKKQTMKNYNYLEDDSV